MKQGRGDGGWWRRYCRLLLCLAALALGLAGTRVLAADIETAAAAQEGGWWRLRLHLPAGQEEARSETGAEIKAEIEAEIKAEIKAEIEAEIKAEIEAEIEAEAAIDSKNINNENTDNGELAADMAAGANAEAATPEYANDNMAGNSSNNGEEVVEYRLAAAFGSYTLEQPYVPLRLLADWAGTPLSWVAEGRCAVWGQQDCGVVLPLEGRRLFYVLEPGAPEETRLHGGVYEEEIYESPFMWQGSLCLPLSLLERLGIRWEYSPAELAADTAALADLADLYDENYDENLDPGSGGYGELGVIDLYLTAEHARGVDPELVWQLTRERVLEYQRPAARLLGRAETSFDSANLGRSQNIYLAAESLHGLRLAAGEEFSFNRAVGPRTAARGFRQAVIFENGRPTLGLGGGICQVSSTLYQAVVGAEGLKVLERHPHSLPVSYAARGQDATVAWGSLDLRWRNDNSGQVYLLCRVTAGEQAKLAVEIWQGELPRELPALFATE